MASDLSDLLLPDLVVVGVAATSKKSLFQHLGALVAPVLALDAATVTAALADRERLGSTGFGGGVAIPHARIEGLPRIVIVVARLLQPIEFNAVDDVPIDIAVAMLSPPDAGADHLKALARVSRRFRDRNFVAKLRGAGSRDALYALLTADESGSGKRDAA
ncbi:PTS sugar transporter subunit IIA [Sphingomonas radiodurans]|uniref:PTS sugar transporter subunit IIA n=1 Tax=Sphingomonas radiodurans TaxID=2890321 RepID=UPI001E2CEA09|nr:PTS sugar transporter subunit IIA [Sphingomonas radiodurans]WBH18128.1 PTS sugar transporter subunit IIA [Sphingomonas radiodurans]